MNDLDSLHTATVADTGEPSARDTGNGEAR